MTSLIVPDVKISKYYNW